MNGEGQFQSQFPLKKNMKWLQIYMYIKLAKENYVWDGDNVEQTKKMHALEIPLA